MNEKQEYVLYYEYYECTFCAYVPANRGEKCMLVIRAEDGLLSDLESIFKDVFRNFCRPEGVLPPGSVT